MRIDMNELVKVAQEIDKVKGENFLLHIEGENGETSMFSIGDAPMMMYGIARSVLITANEMNIDVKILIASICDYIEIMKQESEGINIEDIESVEGSHKN